MREILFRGQMRKKGEKVRLDGSPVDGIWVFGGVSQFNGGERAIIYQTEPCIEKFPVYGDTVGQYTGLTDKNGKKIFEGDIVHCVSSRDDAHMVVIYEEGEFRLVLCKDFKDYKCGLWFYAIRDYAKEVIGNIHDNPELLKGVNE